jgi:hypothetical protein
VVGVDGGTRDGQAETTAACVAAPALVQADESFEDPFPVRDRDGVAIVVHPEHCCVGAGPKGESNRGARVPLRIVHHVPQSLGDP